MDSQTEMASDSLLSQFSIYNIYKTIYKFRGQYKNQRQTGKWVK